MAARRQTSEVLRYDPNGPSRATVRRHYRRWRKEQGIPERCDNLTCRYHTEPLIWNDERLPLILDHENGNDSDNRPENLRLLCGNCDSQLATRGGRNKGRILKSAGGFAVVRPDGKKDYFMPLEPGHTSISGHPPGVVTGHVKRSENS